MSLEQWFYILGIAYVLSWLIILVALVVVGITAYHRYQRLKKQMATRGALFFATSQIIRRLPMEKIVPIITAIPLATKILHALTNKKRKTEED